MNWHFFADKISNYKENKKYYEEYSGITINVNRPALHFYAGDINDVM